jgi:hypothetical protein
VLHETLPFFSLLRAPARFGVLVTLGCAVLAGFGTALWLRRTGPASRRVVLAGLAAVSLAGSSVGPLPLVEAPTVNPVYQYLARLPRAPVVEFPYFSARADIHRHTEYMLMSPYHWQPLVNGYSDHTPAAAVEAARQLVAFPNPEAWQVLSDLHVRYVVLHWHSYVEDGARVRAAVRTDERLRPLIETPSMSLFEVVEPRQSLATSKVAR